MPLFIVNQTKYMVGASATTMLVNDYVNARLGTYGSGIKDVEVTLLYPPKRLAGAPTDLFDKEFRRVLRATPRVTIFRAKRRVDVRFVCRGVSPRSIAGDGHLTFEEATNLVTAASEALELLRSRFRPADKFDVEAFLSDAQGALAKCPNAIKKYLTR